MKLPETIKTALEILSGNGFEAFVVGGCVRDMIMGKTPFDYDITTSALPEQTAACFKDYRVIETGIKHGTVTVVIDGENIEITTYRVDGEYLDNRRPENVSFTSSIEEDLARRDFTMNAIAFSPNAGFVDLFCGEEDIKRGVIRCVGDPDTRFNEDGLRILRALRFASQTGFEIDRTTKDSILRNKNLISNISAERIFSEFIKLLCGKTAHTVVEEYAEVIAVFVPEIMPILSADVFSQMTKSLKNADDDNVIRLAVFLHNIDSYAEKSAEVSREIFKRLKADRNRMDTVCGLIEMQGEAISADPVYLKKIISQKGFEFVKLLIKFKKAIGSTKELSDAELIVNRIETSGEIVFQKDLAVSGDEIINLGVKGAKVGEILKKLLYSVHSGDVKNLKDELIEKVVEFLNNEKS